MKVTVKQKPDVPEIPVELIAQSIEAIAEGMRRLNQTRLTRRALILLIADSSRVNRTEISLVLEALETLEQTFLKAKPAKLKQ